MCNAHKTYSTHEQRRIGYEADPTSWLMMSASDGRSGSLDSAAEVVAASEAVGAAAAPPAPVDDASSGPIWSPNAVSYLRRVSLAIAGGQQLMTAFQWMWVITVRKQRCDLTAAVPHRISLVHSLQ